MGSDSMQYADLTALTYFRGRVALYSILRALGVGRGVEVALQAFTCLAVPEAIIATGARPRFVDVEAEGYNLDAADLEQRITPATRAIVVQHTFGIPADMQRILHVAGQHHLPVIEDCCHTLTSTYEGRRVGTLGIGGFYSFEWGKPLVAGLGGSALVHDRELSERLKADYQRLRTPSKKRCLKIELQYQVFRFLYRPAVYWQVRSVFQFLSRLGAAEGNYNPLPRNEGPAEDFELRMAHRAAERLKAKVGRVEYYDEHSRWVTDQYERRLAECGAMLPRPPSSATAVYARFPLRVANKPDLADLARRANVELAVWYTTPVHPLSQEESGAVGYEPGSCPNAERRCREVVTLPTHSRVGRRYIDKVCRFMNEVPL